MNGAPANADERVRAVSSFFAGDAERILAVAARWRAESATIESVVAGGSMGATLPDGARIRIQLTNRTEYRLGEIIAFLPLNQVVVHRVVGRGHARGRGHWLTRGDSMVVPDPPVAARRILGPVTEVKMAGRWTVVAAQPPGSRRGVWSRRVVLAATTTVLAGGASGARLMVDRVRRLEVAMRRRHR